MKEYPKVLLLCDFNQSESNGITIKNLFQHWPSDKIAVADFSSEIHEIYTKNINKYYTFGNQEYDYLFPFNSLVSAPKSKEYFLTKGFKPETKEKRSAVKYNLAFKLASLFYSFQIRLIKSTGIAYILKKFRISSKFDRWFLEFDPDVLYARTASISEMNFIIKLRKHYNRPLIFHVFDDFINCSQAQVFSFLTSYWSKRLNETYRRMLKHTTIDLVISNKMADEYKEKYNKIFYVFHNPINEKVWIESNQQQENKSKHDPFVFLYAGKINKDTAPALKYFLNVVEEMNYCGYNIQLNIYTQSSYELVYSYMGKLTDGCFRGFINNKHMPRIVKNSDALLLPLSFDKKSIKYTRLSIATKATEYMASGKPIFLFAPRDLAVTEYLESHNSAYIVCDQGNLHNAVSEFINNNGLRERIALNAFQRAIQFHSSKLISESLRKLLTPN